MRLVELLDAARPAREGLLGSLRVEQVMLDPFAREATRPCVQLRHPLKSDRCGLRELRAAAHIVDPIDRFDSSPRLR